MNERDKERAKLDFGDNPVTGTAEKPPIDPAAIRKVSGQAGFRETGATPERSSKRSRKAAPPLAVVADLPRRYRRKTGRVHQFATRIDEPTYRAIYEMANEKAITLGEVIERAMIALTGGPLKKPGDNS